MITLFLNEIKQKLGDYGPYRRLRAGLKSPEGRTIGIQGAEGFFSAILMAEIAAVHREPHLMVVPDEKRAAEWERDLQRLGVDAEIFPGWNTLPYRGDPAPFSVRGKRIELLGEILERKEKVFIVPLRTFLVPLPPREAVSARIMAIKTGEEADPAEMERQLADYGYLRVPKVSVHGEFARRGEVIDVFPVGQDEPIRFLFDFDRVEQIRNFDASTQVSRKRLQAVSILPLTEFLWSDERIDFLEEYLLGGSGVVAVSQEKKNVYRSLVEDLRERRSLEGEEYIYPLTFSHPESLSDYFPGDAPVFFWNFEELQRQYGQINREWEKLYGKSRRSEAITPHPREILHELEAELEKPKRAVHFYSLRDPEQEEHRISLKAEPSRAFMGNVAYLKEELQSLLDSGYRVSIFAETEAQSLRISQLLKDLELKVYSGGISAGFYLPELKIAAISEQEIFGRRKKAPRSLKKVRSEAIDTFVDLSPGDYVVHINYGIGRFCGIERVKTSRTERDYIQLEYAGEEKVFIPIEQVNMIQRYIGNEGRPPALDKIGGRGWENRKSKVRKSVEDMAEQLIKLYSSRKAAQGFAFARDSDWQIEFEALFPYEETEDQLTCIEEVKADMERPEPMDRLVCGDVGYGKTEIAMRAAFKAVVGGRQVAFLAPTTILAEQHYENFCERFQSFPVSLAMVSRFVTKKEQTRVLKETAEGEVDILIGTHRLLQKDVRFKRLGLMIVDEEQRFGVKDKERLKVLKTNIDSLALSATPIPRTLHMSLLKIRDMSLLTTPPSNRRPIQTTIKEFDEEVVAQAVRREIDRGGQVFYLHNRVESLDNVQLFLQKLVPEVFVETAHGKMSSRELEEIMHRFIKGSFQVLVATTIIENGIDIPNVNTIIIDRADMYGISQLYQLRGRVGRSDRPAYAYLLYPEQRALSEIAMKRLQIISDYTELGSGFKVALKDLEIRGAGNLLGRQQHGDILSVGFDMYVRLLDEAIRDRQESRDQAEQRAPDVYLELDYTGYVPESYVDEPVEKMEIYKKITGVQTEEELERVSYEIGDRFGPMPDELLNLLSIAEIRIISRKLFISSLKERKGVIEVEFARVSVIDVNKVMRLINESGGRVNLNPQRPNILFIETGAVGLKEKADFIKDKLTVLL